MEPAGPSTAATAPTLPGPQYLPFLAVVGSWLCYGSFAVPMKWPSVAAADVHPLIYQSYKTFWTFITAHAILLVVPYEFNWWGVVSGFLWVPAGAAAVVAVRNLGIAGGQALWQVTIIATSFVWGFGILHDERVHSWWMAGMGLLCLVLGIVGMTASASADGGKAHRGHFHCLDQAASLKEDDGKPLPKASGNPSIALGVAAAVFNGIWGGSNLVPSKLAPIHGFHFVISFATGALIANVVLLALYALVAKLCWQGSMPPLHFRVMALPGAISGSLWSMGNVLALYCVHKMGQGIGNTLVQLSIIVAGIWGILYYREIVGIRIVHWGVSCTICLFGATVLAMDEE